MIFHLYSLDPRKLTGDGVVIDDLEEKLDIREHDPRGAGDDQINGLALVLPRLDQTIFELPPQAIGISDEARAIDAGEASEPHLFRAPLTGEHLVALPRTCDPRAGEIERFHLLR